MENPIKGKIIVVTGGTGSWGQEFVKQALPLEPKEIRIYSRNEYNQVMMQRKFNDNRLSFFIGDVRDLNQLQYATKDANLILHLAALKHVPICEIYPDEAIKTNIIGTQNIITAALNNKVQKVIDVSSDKATYPLNTYGMTKAIGEKLIINANNLGFTQFVCVRGGNVLGTNGSVVPLFINTIKNEKKVRITDKEMTRFFLSLPEAIELLLVASNTNIAGGIFVMKMQACKIIDLATTLIKELGETLNSVSIEEIGIREGEKIHEVLVNNYEAMQTYKYGENYYVISPTDCGLEKAGIKEYSSNDELLDEEGIKKLLIKGGFLC